MEVARAWAVVGRGSSGCCVTGADAGVGAPVVDVDCVRSSLVVGVGCRAAAAAAAAAVWVRGGAAVSASLVPRFLPAVVAGCGSCASCLTTTVGTVDVEDPPVPFALLVVWMLVEDCCAISDGDDDDKGCCCWWASCLIRWLAVFVAGLAFWLWGVGPVTVP